MKFAGQEIKLVDVPREHPPTGTEKNHPRGWVVKETRALLPSGETVGVEYELSDGRKVGAGCLDHPSYHEL